MTEEPTTRRAANPWIGGRPPHIPASAADVPAACLLPGDPARVALAAQVFDEFDVVGQNREFVFGVGTLGGSRVGVCSTGIGGPSAEIAVVELQRLGASVLIRVGGTAALRHQLPLGTVCTVTRAVRWGGAARPYSPAAAQATPDRELLACLRHEGRDLGIELADVEVVSTDSYYLGQGRLLPGLEGPASREWTALLAQDVDALDMESETVLTVGQRGRSSGRFTPRRARESCDGRVARGLRGPAAQDAEARRSHGRGSVASATTTRCPVALTATSPLVSVDRRHRRFAWRRVHLRHTRRDAAVAQSGLKRTRHASALVLIRPGDDQRAGDPRPR